MLDKGAAFAEARKLDPAALLQARLYPDMHPLVKQVQIFTDQATRGVSRLAGVEPPPFPDTENSFAELKARVEKAAAHVNSFKPAQIDGSETRDIVMKTPRGDLNFTGQQYLLFFSLPNFFFHATTTYSILRACRRRGSAKMDFWERRAAVEAMHGVSLDRRRLIQGSASLSLLGFAGCATATRRKPSPDDCARAGPRERLSSLRHYRLALRPFRAQGPRLDAETGGPQARRGTIPATAAAAIALLGLGACRRRARRCKRARRRSPSSAAARQGLTAAITAQQAGAHVTIYARDMLPDTRSARARPEAGHRICASRSPTRSSPEFPALWEEMARISFKTYRRYLGLPGNPVEWTDRYIDWSARSCRTTRRHR